jgi:cytochrome c1
MKTAVLAAMALAGIAALSAAGAAAFIRLGMYDVAATRPHTAAVYGLLHATMRYSVRARARGIQVPPLREPARLQLGASCYRSHCEQCHGGPGVAQGAVGKSLQPLPGPLIDAARRWKPGEVYWITRHGIKMTGMPAWALRLTDDELWAVTAFVDQLADLSPAAYARAVAQAAALPCSGAGAASAEPAPGGGMQLARLALAQYACVACHRIPGMVGPETDVGPPLAGLWQREVLPAGLAANPENLARWIRHPGQLKPGTAMPDMGVSETHARLMAEYLLQPR